MEITSPAGLSASNQKTYWTPTEVLDRCQARDFPAAWCAARRRSIIDKICSKLRTLCYEGDVRAWWRATYDGERYKPSDAFEAIPTVLWEDGNGIIFPLRPPPEREVVDTVNFIVGSPAFTLYALHAIEVQFLCADLEREFGLRSKPSREGPPRAPARVSETTVSKWMSEYLEGNKSDTQRDVEAAGQSEFGDRVTRKVLRDCLKKLRPSSKPGPRGPGKPLSNPPK
jgi:hypothetical protein